MFRIFTRYNDQHGKCKFVLASESGLFKGERMGEYFPASYRCDMGEGQLLYSSSRYSITCLLNGLRSHAFRFRNTTISFIGTEEETLKHFIYGQSVKRSDLTLNIEILPIESSYTWETVKTARKKGIECLCVCIMPFSTEGEEACLSAEKILDQVKADADILIVLKNDWIQERYGDLLINQAFRKMDTLVYKLISNYITNG